MAMNLARLRGGDGRIVAEPSAADWMGPGPWQTASDSAVPHSYEDVAVGIARGRVACAENGAVAVVGSDAASRSLLVLCQHLVLVVSVGSVVPDLHAGFVALPSDAFAHHHLTWISGPSKTADIEQSLVYGAHGPLTLDVIGVEG
jgi:L-lactate dehydrogenase complex protein LldG